MQVRGNVAMRQIPLLFVMLFCLFIIYLHSFPLGFPYMAFVIWSSFVSLVALHVHDGAH